MLTPSSEPTPKLIYIGDPMCSWCYGIAPELEKTIDHLGTSVELEIVLGGLRPYNTETMSDLGDFLRDHWKHVYEASGQEFTYDILSNSQITYDTEPPCRANVVVRDMAPNKLLAFFKATQTAFYKENKNLHLKESYTAILTELDIDTAEFNRLFSSEEMKEKVKLDFQRSAALGVRSYPTILLQQGENVSVVAQGYAKADKMIAAIEKLIK